jgi:hypothetical protein
MSASAVFGFKLRIFVQDDSCPLKPGIHCRCKIGQCSPCHCPKVQPYSDLGSKITGVVRFDARPTIPDLPHFPLISNQAAEKRNIGYCYKNDKGRVNGLSSRYIPNKHT